MLTCRVCGASNPPQAKLCVRCGASLGDRCTRCGAELLAEARFCHACGAPVPALAEPDAPTQERRLVSVLFVDLVGFTQRSDKADPEDVRRRLVPFHAAVKRDLEGFGGTLDKFIGDAAMGVFGAPVAHEDDAVRAVRAGLRILESIEGLRATDPDIAVRVAVNTGEAIVAFGTGPQIGEAVAGDVVNTASRMQGLAPVGSVVIGEATVRGVGERFDLEPMPPVTVKGKADPLRTWRVLGEREPSETPLAPHIPFVGREEQLALLGDLLGRADRLSSVQTATVLGEPGIGKSRLIQEFRRELGDRVAWLEGRCLPYGEAVTLAAVADTLRVAAGVELSDDDDAVRSKVGNYVTSVELEPSERGWLASRLEVVLGLAGVHGEPVIPAREIARAWSRVVEAESADRALVLSLVDLHWAEPVLVELVESLVESLDHSRVLLLCTARPEVLERFPRWGEARANAISIELPHLDEAQTGRLLSGLLPETVLSDDRRGSLVERSGGNPLYALEFARMLVERGLEGSVADVHMPETVQAVIAARLDAIPPGTRAIVQDASSVGSSFWAGALSQIGSRTPDEVRDALRWLEGRGLVHRAAASSLPGEDEYTFSHALIGEVAYARMPRAQRARRHSAVAEWIERAAGGRAEDHAETLAHHFASAFELAESSDTDEVAGVARDPAIRWLLVAGERTSRVDPAGAFALFDRAVRISHDETEERGRALARSGFTGRRSGRLDAQEVLERYEASLAIAQHIGDPHALGRALTSVGSQLGAMGETSRARGVLAEAVATLESQSPGPDLARAYAHRAQEEMYAGRVRESVLFADRAIELQGGRPGDEVSVMALHIRGDGRCSVGDLGGLDDLREALQLSEDGGSGDDIVTSLAYLGEWEGAMEGPLFGLARYEASLELASRRGSTSQGLWAKTERMEVLCQIGEWNRALLEADELIALGRNRIDETLYAISHVMRSRILLLRGRYRDGTAASELLELARPVEELQLLAPALVVAAMVGLAGGEAADALAHLREFDVVTRDVATQYRESQLPDVVRCCLALGERALAERLVELSEGLVLRDRLNVLAATAAVSEAAGEPDEAARRYAEAAHAFHAFPNPFEEAIALKGRSRCLALLGARDESGQARIEAERIFERLGVVFDLPLAS